jgi:hypothetical protein
MGQYVGAGIMVAPGLLVLLCLGYVHFAASTHWLREAIFWASVLVASSTIFAFFRTADLCPWRGDGGSSMKATLYSHEPSPELMHLWTASLGAAIVAALACVIHFILRSRRSRP